MSKVVNLYNFKSSNIIYYSLFLLLSFIANWFSSLDNPYFHNTSQHMDSAMFFMAGKAWANGMIPYVDFADSKGPVLWLITMLAYLISPHNYAGIFIIVVITQSFALYFLWRLNCKVIGNKLISFVATLPMIFVFLYGMNFFENRAETYAQLPLSYLFYVMIAGLYKPESLTKRVAFLCGLCLMCLLLIKWTFFIIAGTISLGQATILFVNRHKDLVQFIIYNLYGMALTFLPFFIYFLFTNSIYPFVKEYFINTFLTISTNEPRFVVVRTVFTVFFSTILYWGIFIGALIGNTFAFTNAGKLKYLPGMVTLFFIIGTTLSINFAHYMQLIVFLCISMFTLAARGCNYILAHKKKLAIPMYVVILFLFIYMSKFFINSKVLPTINREPTPQERAFLKTDQYITNWSKLHKRKPLLLYLDRIDVGLGLEAEALPATKYWFVQGGALPEMSKDIKRAASLGKADFLIVQLKTSLDLPFEEWGYTKVSEDTGLQDCFRYSALYERKASSR